MDNKTGKTPQGRLDLYIASCNMFNNGYSHPQIVEALSSHEANSVLLTSIVDKAMKEEWDKIYNDAIRLFALGRIRAEVVNELSKKENDTGVVEILVDNLYNRHIEFIDEFTDRIRKRNQVIKIIRYASFAIAFFFVHRKRAYLFNIRHCFWLNGFSCFSFYNYFSGSENEKLETTY